ncbi:hypothetical protein [Brevundimonas sp. MEB006b]|uniref:hypothetical protein n=1 Tax=Brevundimonas sp. MEB006b TaxID=3040283 RepID=UPI002551829B|nr:hypothetical protein [Brevundimonas sp. MEB006b]
MTEPVAAPKPSTVRRVHTSLQRQMARPGGRLIIEAESRANQALDEQRDHVFTLLTANVDAIEALCATRPQDAPAQIYAFASAMVDMAGYLDVPTFFEAAFSLCEIADRMKGAGSWSWPSVEVHVRALRLTLAAQGQTSADSNRLLEGLRALTAHVPPVG